MLLIVYEAGPAWQADAPPNDQLRDHGRYMFGLHQKKALKLSGPFLDITGGAALVEAGSLAGRDCPTAGARAGEAVAFGKGSKPTASADAPG